METTKVNTPLTAHDTPTDLLKQIGATLTLQNFLHNLAVIDTTKWIVGHESMEAIGLSTTHRKPRSLSDMEGRRCGPDHPMLSEAWKQTANTDPTTGELYINR